MAGKNPPFSFIVKHAGGNAYATEINQQSGGVGQLTASGKIHHLARTMIIFK
jgi:hypothetical protein